MSVATDIRLPQVTHDFIKCLPIPCEVFSALAPSCTYTDHRGDVKGIVSTFWEIRLFAFTPLAEKQLLIQSCACVYTTCVHAQY